jgi:hypothetical protein
MIDVVTNIILLTGYINLSNVVLNYVLDMIKKCLMHQWMLFVTFNPQGSSPIQHSLV